MKRWPFSQHRVFNLLISIVIVGITTLFLVLLRPYLSISVVALLYLVPVIVCAALLGRLAGIAASVSSFLIFNYFFISPYYTFRVGHPQDFLAMIVLLSVAILISSLMARIQANLEQVRAHERETIQLYELSEDLSGKNDQTLIAKILARRLAALYENAAVEVEIFHQATPIREREPENEIDRFSTREAPRLILPLSSPHGQLGEIRIWHIEDHLQPEKERLLHTFASQGALALDRSILAYNETRTRVLEESDRLKTAILSSVSHDLRTPLASIQAAASSLYDPDIILEASARNELLSILLEETDTMAQLVGNLLNMSRIEAGALKLQREWNSFSEIVDTGLRRLKRHIADWQINVDVPEDLPLISVDSVLMEQVVINLVRNCLKFAPRNSTIDISASVKERRLIITVTNHGPAIPEEFIQHVFEKFYPVPGQDTSQSTGLGLSICKGIVEAHGGTIWAENLADGVAFHFYLPLIGDRTLLAIPDEEMEGR